MPVFKLIPESRIMGQGACRHLREKGKIQGEGNRMGLGRGSPEHVQKIADGSKRQERQAKR